MASRTWNRVLGGSSPEAGRPDRVLPATRWVALFIVPFLAAAFLVLYGLPDRTTELFAWTIRPEMTPIVMGAGYGAGVYFFARVYAADRWHTVAPVFPGIATFTWFMAVATAIHWESFNHGHYTFALWVFLYAVTPLIVPGIWLLNRRTDPGGPGTETRPLPRTVRLLGGGLGLAVSLSSVLLFALPSLLIDVWPWAVSPLTARILAGWFALFGVVNVAAASDPRWTGSRILIQSQAVGFGLVLVGALRYWDNFDRSNVLTWAVVAGMVLYLFAIVALYVGVESD